MKKRFFFPQFLKPSRSWLMDLFISIALGTLVTVGGFYFFH